MGLINVRGPLEVLRDSWIDGNVPECTLIDWVQQIKTNLMDFSIIASDRTALAKCKMKSNYNKHSHSVIDFPVGSMVLVRTPGLSSKLDDAWSGPYEVLRLVTPVTWELAVPDAVKKKWVVHANMLKPWHTADSRVCRVVIAVDDDSVTYQPPLHLGLLLLLSCPNSLKFIFLRFCIIR